MTLIHFDTETFLIAPALQAPPIVCLQYAKDREDPEIVPAWEDRFDELWVSWLRDPTVYFSAYNGRFDFACLCARNPDLYLPLVFDAFKARRITDTMVREILLRIGRADGRKVRGLGHCLEDHGVKGVDKSDPWRKRYGELWLKPLEAWDGGALHYALEDARAERDLFWSQQNRFDGMCYACPDQFAQTFSAFWLYLMQCWGARTDPVAAGKYAEQVREELEKGKILLREHGLIDAKGKKETKVAKALMVAAFEALGQPCPRTDTGEPSLDKDACQKSRDPRLMAYSNYAQAGTLLGKIELLKKPIIQPSYNVMGADSGRTSCRQGDPPAPGEAPTSWGAQMQNPPRKEGVRECYVAEPGCAIVSIDFETFELRTLAQTCWWRFRYSMLREILNDAKRCAHVEMGARLTDRTVAEAYALKGLDKDLFKEMRNMAKGPNFGLPGYMGWRRLIGYCWDNYGVVISPELAQKAVRVWKEIYPEMPMHLESARAKCVKVIGKNDNGEAILGGDFMTWTTGRLRSSIPITELANMEFQPLAADAAKFAGGRLAEACYVRGVNPIVYGCRPFGFVHDEFLFSVPLEGLHEKAYELARIQVEAAQEFIPDVTVRAEPGAMLRWSKKAGDPAFDRDGKLIPFEWKEAA